MDSDTAEMSAEAQSGETHFQTFIRAMCEEQARLWGAHTIAQDCSMLHIHVDLAYHAGGHRFSLDFIRMAMDFAEAHPQRARQLLGEEIARY